MSLIQKGSRDAETEARAIIGHPLRASTHFSWSEVAFIDTVALSGVRARIFGSICHEQLLARANALSNNIHHTESCRLALSPSQVKELVLFSFWKPFLPTQVASRVTQEILHLLRKAMSTENDTMLPCLVSLALQWIEISSFSHEGQMSSSPMPLDAALKTWRISVEACESDDTITPVAQNLEMHLSYAMTSGRNESSSLLYSLLLHVPLSETVKLCLQSKVLSSKRKNRLSHRSFLASNIANDPIAFGTAFLECVAESLDHDETILLLERGLLDEEIIEILRCKELLSTECFVKAKDTIVNRALNAVFAESFIDDQGYTSHIIEGIRALLSFPGMLKAHHMALLVSRALNSLLAPNIRESANVSLLELAYAVLCMEDPTETFDFTDRRASLASFLLLRLLERIRVLVKTYFKRKPESQNSVRGDCLEVFGFVFNMINMGMMYDGNLVSPEGLQIVTGAIKACLKYGMAHAVDEDARIAESCLRFIRVLFVEVSDSSSSLHQLRNECILLDPARTLAMVVTHSHFNDVLKGRDTQSKGGAVLELVRLLLVCTSMSLDTVSFETEVWDTLMKAYTAGMSPMDQVLRRLFCLYAETLETRGKVS